MSHTPFPHISEFYSFFEVGGAELNLPWLPQLGQCGTHLSLCSTPLVLFQEATASGVRWRVGAGGSHADDPLSGGVSGGVSSVRQVEQAEIEFAMQIGEAHTEPPFATHRHGVSVAVGGGLTGFILTSALALVLGSTWRKSSSRKQ